MAKPFDDLYIPEPNTGCWLWLGVERNGYGTYTVRANGRKKMHSAHRFAWERVHGPIPKGLFACHRCDTPGCVNPDHIFLGTPRDNFEDMRRKRRHTWNRRTHCINGHEYTPENTYMRKDRPTARMCRKCDTPEGRKARLARLGGVTPRTNKATHCRRGHPYTPENTLPKPDPYTGSVFRACKTCSQANNRKRYLRRRERAASRPSVGEELPNG